MIPARIGFLAAISILALTAAAPPQRQAAMKEVLRVYSTIAEFSKPSISPDGSRVAFEKTIHHDTTLWIQAVGSQHATRLTAGTGKQAFDESNPVWSPDGTRVAFFSDARSKDHPALYLADVNGANVRRLNSLGGLPQNLQWSPDGHSLAFLYIVKPHRKSGAI
ncbi:MAG TPA: hypothetical protein VKB39_03020, partial [Candidatus Baltobacteraceae bacterium]|nr:hypothetical protein [Candidatus Baltobacteraceae bacterium]